MYTLFISLTIIAAVLLVLVVLAQNSKGGGLSSQFGGSGEIHFLPYHTYGMHKYHLLGREYLCARQPLERPELLVFAEQQATDCGLTAILRG